MKKEELEAQRFLCRGVKYLRTAFEEKTRNADDETLKNKLIDICELAQSCGFETEREIMELADLLWRLPEQTDPAALGAVLKDETLSPALKIEALKDTAALFPAVAEVEEEPAIGN